MSNVLDLLVKTLTENAVTASRRQRDLQDLKIKVRGVRTFYDGDGQISIAEDCRHPARKHELDSLDDLCRLAVDIEAMTGRREVWHDHLRVVLQSIPDPLVQDIETATLRLQPAHRFAVLANASGKLFDQRQLVRLFKYELVDGVDPGLVNVVRSLNFVAHDQASTQVESQRDSLGRSIERQVSGLTDLPDSFTVTTPVYQNAIAEFLVEVRCSLDVDFDERKFRFVIVGDDLANGIRAAQEELATELVARIGDDQVKVYAGRPS